MHRKKKKTIERHTGMMVTTMMTWLYTHEGRLEIFHIQHLGQLGFWFLFLVVEFLIDLS